METAERLETLRRLMDETSSTIADPGLAPPAPGRRKISLTTKIMIGLVVGLLVGWIRPTWGINSFFLRDIFLNLIKSVISPLIFATIVVGIVNEGDLKRVGRMGVKALIYFEVVTTFALFIGLGVVNVVKPGVGVTLSRSTAELNQIAQNHPKNLIETIVHIFPANIFEAMAKGDVLQIVAFSILFAAAVMAMGEKGKPVLHWCESLSHVMFKFTEFIMKFAPVGVGAAMAFTIGRQGPGVLINLGKLIGSLYAA